MERSVEMQYNGGKERVHGVPTPPIPRATFHGIENPEAILDYNCVLNYISKEELLHITTHIKYDNPAEYTTILDNLNLLCYKDKYFKTYPLTCIQKQEIFTISFPV